MVAHSWRKGIDAWFESWQRQFFSISFMHIASWINAVIRTYICLHVGRHFSLLSLAFFPSFSQPVFEHSSTKNVVGITYFSTTSYFSFLSFSQPGSERTSFFLSAHGTALSSFVLHFPVHLTRIRNFYFPSFLQPVFETSPFSVTTHGTTLFLPCSRIFSVYFQVLQRRYAVCICETLSNFTD